MSETKTSRSAGIVFIDVETGGLDPETDALLSIGACVWKDGQISDPRLWHVDAEGMRLEPKAMKINKIDMAEHRRKAYSRLDVAAELYRWLDGLRPDPRYKLRLGGHNVPFDIRFIRKLLDLSDESWKTLVSPACVDTAGILTFMRHAGILPAGADLSLRNGLRAAGVPFSDGDLHTALGDAMNTARLYGRLIAMVQHGRE